MQRPVRIIVLGVLCLLVGSCSAMNNLSDLNTVLNGADGLVVPDNLPSGGAVGAMIQQTVEAVRGALRNPVYRWSLGIESAVGAAMAALLCVAGVGLLRDRLWAVRLTRVWGGYALFAAMVSVVLQVRFVVPRGPQAATLDPAALVIAQVVGGGCSLVGLWLFPVLLLVLINRPAVLNYLRWRVGEPVPTPAERSAQTRPRPPAQTRSAGQPRPDEPEAPARPPAQPSPPPGPPPADQTWRDDPWNDPSSR